MRLRELIDALTKLETVCGIDTETECQAVGLSIKTVLTWREDSYYAYRGRTEENQVRSLQHMITISALPLNQPYTPTGYQAETASEHKP